MSSSLPAAAAVAGNGTGPSMRRIGLLKGHSDAVACLAATSDGCILASGAEDGTLCLHSLLSWELLSKSVLSDTDAVAAVVFHPVVHPSSSSSGYSLVLFAAAGRELQQLTVTVPAGWRAQHHNTSTQAAATAAAASGGLTNSKPAAEQQQQQQQQQQLELQVVARQVVSLDDISALAINHQGTYLAAADDTGDINLFDLSKLQLQLHKQPQLQPTRCIKAAHEPLASAACFRRHKPWQLLSAGLDSRVACWDFSRSRKCCAAWNMTEMTPSSSCSSGGKGGAAAAEDDGPGGQVWNPPMVHALAVPLESSSSSSSVQSETKQLPLVEAAPALLKRIAAVARGDGVVAVFDADGDAKPTTTSSSSSRTAGAGAETGISSSSSSTTSKSQNGKGKRKGSKQGNLPTAQQPLPAAQQTSAAAPNAATHPQQHQQQQQQVSQLQPGFSVCLGPSQGGHSQPASAVTFLPWQGGGRYLLSGGEDGRLLLWDWQAALAAAAAAAGSAVGGSGTCEEAGAQAASDPGASSGGSSSSRAGVPASTADTQPASAAKQEAGFLAAAAAAPVAGEVAAAAAAATTEAGRAQPSCLLVDRQHKRKVNALCCVQQGKQGQCLVAVADTSRTVSVMLMLSPFS